LIYVPETLRMKKHSIKFTSVIRHVKESGGAAHGRQHAASFSHFKRSFFMFRILFSLTLFCTLFSVSGCKDSSRPEDLPKLFPCVITITQEGKPLEEASVELVATDQNNAKYKSLSITDAEGRAVMSTLRV
jgi:hypothetical protein